MNFDPTNEQHRKTLVWACTHRAAAKLVDEHVFGLGLEAAAARALASPIDSAKIVRALLHSFGIEPCAFPYPGFEDMKCCRQKEHVPPHADCVGGDGYTCVNPEHHASDWQGVPKPIEPALILALLEAKDKTAAIAACEEHSR
jgi:hypothetical protein